MPNGGVPLSSNSGFQRPPVAVYSIGLKLEPHLCWGSAVSYQWQLTLTARPYVLPGCAPSSEEARVQRAGVRFPESARPSRFRSSRIFPVMIRCRAPTVEGGSRHNGTKFLEEIEREYIVVVLCLARAMWGARRGSHPEQRYGGE